MKDCSINITSDLSYKYEYSTVSWSVILICVPLITIIGACCNFAFIFVVYRVKTMRTTTNIFLVNLAVADLSLLITSFSQYIGTYAISPVYDVGFSFYSNFGCIMHDLLTYLCYYASLWTIALVSIERYLAICRPLWHRVVDTKRRAMRMVFATWCISLLFASLTVPMRRSRIVCLISADHGGIAERIPQCTRDCKWCNVAINSTDLLQFVAALFVNIILYSLIVRRLNTSSSEDAFQGGNLKKNGSKIRNSVARMLIINGIVFFVCLSPFSVNNIDSVGRTLEWFSLDQALVTSFTWIARFFFLLNSALNPLIYNATNPRYRLAFKEAFHSPRMYQLICNQNLVMSPPLTGTGNRDTKTAYLWIYWFR